MLILFLTASTFHYIRLRLVRRPAATSVGEDWEIVLPSDDLVSFVVFDGPEISVLFACDMPSLVPV